MAYEKKQENKSYKKLLADIKSGEIGQLYVFWGEEEYLKSYYLGQIKQKLCGDFTNFNYALLEGDRLDFDQLSDALFTLPMGSERKLVAVRDYKLMQPGGDLKDRLAEILAQLPDYICLVFYFEALEFKADKRLNIYKALEKHGQIVEFEKAPAADLIPWLKRRFSAVGKSIDTAECEHMLFLCGYSMTNLITEVDKISAGAKRSTVTKQDIDALASRVLEADVFELTNRVTEGKYGMALDILRDLLDMRHEPVAILAAVTKQFQRLYGARLALEAKEGEGYVMELAGYRSAYPARLLMNSARRLKLPQLRAAQIKCLECDVSLKSNIADSGRTLELLVLQLSQDAAA